MAGIQSMITANNLGSNVQRIKRRQATQYRERMKFLTAERNKLLAEIDSMKQANGNTAPLEQKLTNFDTKIGNLETAKKQMLEMLENEKVNIQDGLSKNKTSNALIGQKNVGLARAAASNAGATAGELLSITNDAEADTYRKNLAAEEAAAKAVSSVYDKATNVPYNIESLRLQQESQSLAAKQAKDAAKSQALTTAFSVSQLTDKQRAEYEKRKKEIDDQYLLDYL